MGLRHCAPGPACTRPIERACLREALRGNGHPAHEEEVQSHGCQHMRPLYLDRHLSTPQVGIQRAPVHLRSAWALSTAPVDMYARSAAESLCRWAACVLLTGMQFRCIAGM